MSNMIPGGKHETVLKRVINTAINSLKCVFHLYFSSLFFHSQDESICDCTSLCSDEVAGALKLNFNHTVVISFQFLT